MTAREHGFSLVQLLIIVAIVAIIASQSVQSFSTMLKAIELKGAVQLVYFQIQAARHQAIAKQQDIQLDIVDGQYWCIGITDQATCNCQSSQSCTIDGVEKVTSYDEFRFVQLAASTFAHNNQSRFSPPRGLAQGYAGSVTLTNAEQDFKVIVSNTGRVRICALNQAISHYPKC
ncbi:MAG: hypothetical protein CBB67_010760 [Alteromonadaceae bacterium TMED7]|uniref:Type II secretion system protein H n=1 Tax=Alteromonas alba TaxID=2079529 RepID=A0A2S9V7C1_9ALTE|nr:GspH/FimT family pseudopilin [Alteromonas alba]MAJ68507.1 hypothetical protein [Alteromonadaceae bacterium]MCP4864667.1 hypothetical protein [Alteromonas sp.]PRO72367.1 hypothetical protein C6Y40_17065 [Alteromonas alba]RPH18414.1 MAG: hypothetical protein CBB67_010760 [Alteromonadaceae bacterium TMED7]|tara:strand:+ start:2102 stop:2623 length:522 start_codon:yes stop_codon:yes gene_type:complete